MMSEPPGDILACLTPCTRVYTGAQGVHSRSDACASGVHPVYTLVTRREVGSGQAQDACAAWVYHEMDTPLLLLQARIANLGLTGAAPDIGSAQCGLAGTYGHPVMVVGSFVGPDQFCSTVYTANGWQELGLTDGWGRCRHNYCVQHDKRKRLFVRELANNARRSRQAEQFKPALAGVEKKAGACRRPQYQRAVDSGHTPPPGRQPLHALARASAQAPAPVTDRFPIRYG